MAAGAEVGLDHLLVLLHLGGRALGDLLAVVEHGEPVAQAHHQLHVVLDQQDGAAVLADLVDQLAQHQLLARVHAGGGFVERDQLGVGRQCARDLEPALVAVAECSRLVAGVLGAMFQNAATKAEEAAIRQRAIDLLHYVRIEERADELARNLSYGDQRRLEIARALATEPKLLCLDEPAAGMNATETGQLRELIDGIRRDGTTILLIEHDVKLVMGLCDRVAVLDYGELVIEDVPAVVQKDQRVIEAYLGA